jgi:hypothetical protein
VRSGDLGSSSIVGTARVAAATGNIVKALAVAMEIADEEAQDEE